MKQPIDYRNAIVRKLDAGEKVPGRYWNKFFTSLGWEFIGGGWWQYRGLSFGRVRRQGHSALYAFLKDAHFTPEQQARVRF